MFILNFTTILLILVVFIFTFFDQCDSELYNDKEPYVVISENTGTATYVTYIVNLNKIENWGSCYETYIGERMVTLTKETLNKFPPQGIVREGSSRVEESNDGDHMLVSFNGLQPTLSADIHDPDKSLGLAKAYGTKVFLMPAAQNQAQKSNPQTSLIKFLTAFPLNDGERENDKDGVATILVKMKRQPLCNEDPEIREGLNELLKTVKDTNEKIENAVNKINEKNILGSIIATYQLIRNSSAQACTSTSCCFPPYICSSFYQQGGK